MFHLDPCACCLFRCWISGCSFRCDCLIYSLVWNLYPVFHFSFLKVHIPAALFLPQIPEKDCVWSPCVQIISGKMTPWWYSGNLSKMSISSGQDQGDLPKSFIKKEKEIKDQKKKKPTPFINIKTNKPTLIQILK